MSTRDSIGVKACIAGMAVLVATGAALARPDARAMTCGQAQALIERNGAVVMSTGRYTYERFVDRVRGSCQWMEDAVVTYIPTRDTAECPVYHCEQRVPRFNFQDR